jgi:hypothetical protein
VLSIEDAQKVIDLRARMLENIQNGKSAEEGITQEELRLALDAVRSNRSAAAAAGAAKATRAKKKSAGAVQATEPTTSVAANPKFAKFLNKNFD